MYEDIKQKFNEIEKQLSDPSVANDVSKLTEISKKHAELKDVMGMIFELEKIEVQPEQKTVF